MTKDPRPEAETHESFGTISICRAQGRFDNLFGSNIDTNHAVHLTIQRAERRHEHAHDWIHGREELVSVYLSPLQFAEFLTSMGQGEGIPCTLDRVAGTKMEQPPETEATARKVVREFVEKTEDIAVFAKGADQLVKDILAKGQKMKKGDREELQSIMTKMVRLTTDSAPFLIKQAEEHIDKMVSEAKATITQHANVLGVEAGAVTLPKALGGGDTPVLDDGPVEFEPETDYERDEQYTRERCGGVEFEPEPGDIDYEEPEDRTQRSAFEYLDSESPEIPDLPEREIEGLEVDDMNAAQVAEKIFGRLRRLEALGIDSGGSGGKRFYGAQAYDDRGKVYVTYVSFHGSTKLTLDQAKEYLKGLNAGSQDRHHEFFRK
jgi:hypothetical protein